MISVVACELAVIIRLHPSLNYSSYFFAWGPQALLFKQSLIGGKRRKETRSPAATFTTPHDYTEGKGGDQMLSDHQPLPKHVWYPITTKSNLCMGGINHWDLLLSHDTTCDPIAEFRKGGYQYITWFLIANLALTGMGQTCLVSSHSGIQSLHGMIQS